MGISSLGVGSGVLTQNLIDQLKAADRAKFVTHIENNISLENEKSGAFDVIEAHIDSVYESLISLTEYGVFESRTTSVSNESIASVSAKESSDIQDFTLDVTTLATHEIEQSGSFNPITEPIATTNGSMEINVGDKVFPFDYDASTTLEELKELINKTAGDSVHATIVQVTDNDFRLLLNATETGTGEQISITDNDTGLKNALSVDMSNIQTAVDAQFTYNGLDITRKSNSVDDLLSGVSITLKDIGKVDVSVEQNRENIESKITNFIDKYNSAMFQLSEDTKSSQEIDTRGIFSSDSTIKSMKSSLSNILSTMGQGVGSIQDYGIEVDSDGRLSFDSSILNEKLDDNSANVKSFFTGGEFTKDDGSIIELEGAFVEVEDIVAKYSKYNAVLDQFKDSLSTRLDSLTDQQDKTNARLASSYAIMEKRFAAYDLIISKFNTASSMFSQMINTELATNRN